MTNFRDNLAKKIQTNVEIGPIGKAAVRLRLTPSEAEDIANTIVESVIDADDYVNRLEHAIENLQILWDDHVKIYGQDGMYAGRLHGKIEGVKLALSYFNEELRRHE